MIFFYITQTVVGFACGESRQEVWEDLVKKYKTVDIFGVDDAMIALAKANKDPVGFRDWVDKNLRPLESTWKTIEELAPEDIGYAAGANFANTNIEILFTSLEQALDNGYKPDDLVTKKIKYYVATMPGGFLGETGEMVPHISKARRFTNKPLCRNCFGVGQ